MTLSPSSYEAELPSFVTALRGALVSGNVTLRTYEDALTQRVERYLVIDSALNCSIASSVSQSRGSDENVENDEDESWGALDVEDAALSHIELSQANLLDTHFHVVYASLRSRAALIFLRSSLLALTIFLIISE